MAHYAWSPIRGGTSSENPNGTVDRKAVNVEFGDSVDAKKLGVDEANWQELVDAGVVREAKPPKLPDTWQDSAVNYIRQQAQLAEGSAPAETLDENQLAALEDAG